MLVYMREHVPGLRKIAQFPDVIMRILITHTALLHALFRQFAVPGWPHELVGGFLSILLVFRTDQAYDR
jgi:hypothetical protein